jgi:uncharacterized protein YjiK
MRLVGTVFVVVLLAVYISAKNHPLNPISAHDIGSFVSEPSGASYSEVTNSLWIICDKPSCHYVYEMDITGQPIRAWKYAKGDHDDVEGVAVDDGNRLVYIVEEGYMRITAFDLPQVSNHTSYHTTSDDADYHLNEVRQIIVDVDVG